MIRHTHHHTTASYLTAWADYLRDPNATLKFSYTNGNPGVDLHYLHHEPGPLIRWLLDPPPGPTPGGHQ